MTSTRLLVSCALLLGAVGCAATPASEPAAASDDALTGVMDLSEMESMLGLYKDEKDQNGAWYRSEEKLKSGPCYQKLIAGPSGADYQFRRYTTGAAFFKKAGAGFASGDDRPIFCVDVDTWYDDGTQEGFYDTLSISDIEIDAVLRYRLGAPTGGDGAAGTFYDEFQYGDVTTHGAYCPETGFDPLTPEALSSYCFGSISAPGISSANGGLQVMVYQYAYEHALTSDRFSMAADPIGRFISMEGTWEDQTIHFEKADARATVDPNNVQTLTLATKSGDVFAKCTRTPVSTNEDDFFKVQCSGL